MQKVLIADADRCTGCRTCELVCKGKNRSSRIKILKNELFDVSIPAVSIKCDLCSGKPSCAEFCAAGALKLASFGEAALLRKKCKIGMFPVPLVK